MIKPGSRYANENDGCATVETNICEGGSWKRLTFDDGYQNYYQHQDLVACEVKLPACQANDETWNAGWGLCPTYAEGQTNHYYCGLDQKDGLFAKDVCQECGEC